MLSLVEMAAPLPLVLLGLGMAILTVPCLRLMWPPDMKSDQNKWLVPAIPIFGVFLVFAAGLAVRSV